MTTRVGYTAWSAAGKTWPSGSAVGDLSVFISMDTGTFRYSSPELKRWRTVGQYKQRSQVGLTRWYTWNVGVFTKTLTSDDLASPPPDDYGQVMVLRGHGGIGAVRSGFGGIWAKDGGGVISVSRTSSSTGSDLPPGPSWQSPAGVVTRPALTGPVTSRAMVGWTPANSTGHHGAGDPFNALAIEILPVEGPLPPSILAPSDTQAVSIQGIVNFSWAHRPSAPGGYQDAYRLRIDRGAGWEYWNDSTDTLLGSEYSNLSGQQTVEIAASKLTKDVLHVWQVSTRDGLTGIWSPYSASSSFTPVTPPSVSVTAPDGVVSNNLRPVVTWSSSTPGGAQTAYRVQVVDAASTALVFDSQMLPGDAQDYEVPVQDWLNGDQYTVRVMIQQTGGAESSWATSTFTISWDDPPAPTLTATPEQVGIKVVVEVTQPMFVTVERIGMDGIWHPIMQAVEADAGVPVERVDVFAPYGHATAYRAVGVKELDGQFLKSQMVVTNPVVSIDRNGYIALAENPTMTWFPITFVSTDSHEHVENVTSTYGLDDDYGRVTYGLGQGESGQVTAWVISDEARDGLLGMLRQQRALLVRFKPEVRSDGSGDWGPGKVMTWARSSSISEESVLPHRPGQFQIQAKRLSFAWIEQPDETLDSTVTL